MNNVHYLIPNTEMYNSLFTSHELTTALSKCGNTSVGPDQIAYQFFANLPESGLITLLNTLNQLWENTCFLHPGAKASSYLSSSLLNILRSFQVKRRIMDYLESNNILTNNQKWLSTRAVDSWWHNSPNWLNTKRHNHRSVHGSGFSWFQKCFRQGTRIGSTNQTPSDKHSRSNGKCQS